MSQENLNFVSEVCAVDSHRANELLQAASGSVERAVEIHFGTTMHTPSTMGRGKRSRIVPDGNVLSKKRRARTTKQASPCVRQQQQPSIRSFFAASDGTGVPMATTAEKKVTISPTKSETSSALVRIKRMDESEASSRADEDRYDNQTSTPSRPDDPRMRYAALAEAFSEMTATSKRLTKLDSLRNVLVNVMEAVGGIHGDERTRIDDARILQNALELILGTAGTTLQVSGSAVTKAVLAVTGASPGKLREVYRKTGDLGDASEFFVRNQTLLVKPKPLTISSVHETLRMIAIQEGKGSQSQRHTLMVKLLRSCSASEMKFLVRTLLGNMRLGANVRTVLAALGHAVENLEATQAARSPDFAPAAKAIQDTFDFCPRFDKLCLGLLCGGISLMEQTCVLEVGTPVNPMLANAAHSLDEVEKLLEGNDDTNISRRAVAEWKYDGVRCQAHYDGSRVALFSRHMLENTTQFPDVVEALLAASSSNATSFIVDAEIVAVDPLEDDGDLPAGQRLLPFQDLSTRRGSTQKEANHSPVPVCIFAFDLLYLNGASLVKEPLWKRQDALKQYFSETAGFKYAASIALDAYDKTVVTDFLETAIEGGAEGLMIKLTAEEFRKRASGDSSHPAPPLCIYESGARSQTWLKVKRDYVSGYADTIDVVPIGAWFGNGRKAQKRFLSPVLLAVYDDEEDVYRSVSRCMSFTDAMYDATREFYFHGTSYPSTVGVDDRTVDIHEVSAEMNDNGELGMEMMDASAPGSLDESARHDRVNCYPSKPSSAVVITNENPPVWFKPSEVWEVSFADLTLSRTHTAAAGLVHDTRGVALRFPRFKRRRPDKRIDQATTSKHIAMMYTRQSKQGGSYQC